MFARIGRSAAHHARTILTITVVPLDISMLVLLFCIAFGLSMDYEVHDRVGLREAPGAQPIADGRRT